MACGIVTICKFGGGFPLQIIIDVYAVYPSLPVPVPLWSQGDV